MQSMYYIVDAQYIVAMVLLKSVKASSCPKEVCHLVG